MAPATSEARFASQSTTTTLAPWAAKVSTIERPMPLPEPVTRAILLSSDVALRSSMLGLLCSTPVYPEPPGASSWTSMAVVTIFAESRFKAIKAAVKEKKNWPTTWLADVHAAYSLLRRHPLGTDGQVLWHFDLMTWIGADRRATRVLTEGISRFRDSPRLHQALRDHLLKKRGAAGLESTYEQLLKKHEDPMRLTAFAGVASFAAAESFRRTRHYDEALVAYERSIRYYEKAVEAYEGHRAGADRTIAMAWAGRARVLYQLGKDESATEEILASFKRSPDSAGTRDGIGISPGETAQMLLARLIEKKREDLARPLALALAGIAPELLAPDQGLVGDR